MIDIKDKKLRLFAVISLAFALGGCGNTLPTFGKKSPEKTEKPTPQSQQQVFVAEPGLSARQRFSKSLVHLENGEAQQALAELEAYLVDVPNSSSAKRLIEQIKTDPKKYFPKEHFTVDLTSGTSLSTLAKKYLGSALRFYALAKYNNISNPSRVNIGQKIKIPLTQLARSVQAKELAAKDAPVIEPVTEKKVEEKVAAKIEQPIKEELANTPELPKVDEVQETVVSAEVLTSELEGYNASGDYGSAMKALNSLRELGDTQANDGLALATLRGYANSIKDTDAPQASKSLFEAGELSLKVEDQLSAFKDFKLASELDGENTAAMEEMLVLQKDISDKYHREASTAFRKQELDLAIAKWDKVLAVDPHHSNAQLYRAQAIELKERLKKINEK